MTGPPGRRTFFEWFSSHPVPTTIGILATIAALIWSVIDYRYATTIDALRQKNEDSKSELSASMDLRDDLQERLNAIEGHTPGGAQRAVADTQESHQSNHASMTLRLVQSHPVLFWNDQCRIELTATYTGLRNAVFVGYLGREPFRWDIYAHTRGHMAFAGNEYYLDVVEIGTGTATLNITRMEP